MTEQREQTIKHVTFVGIGINITLSLAQIVAGLLAHSQALVADGMHTLADLVSDFVVIAAAHHAARGADAAHPYGHARIETLSSIFLGVALIGVAVGMGYRGVQSILSPSVDEIEFYALFFAFAAIVSKEFLYRYTMRAARKIHSSLLEGNALHHRSDVFSSIVVVIGVGGQLAGIPHMDAAAAIIVSIMVLLMGYHLVKKSFAELIDTSLDQDLVDRIRQHVIDIDGVADVHRLRSRSMGGQGYIDLEIRVNPRLSVSEAHFISVHIENSIKRAFDQIADVTVHIDPLSDRAHEDLVDLPLRAEVLFSLYSAWESVNGSENISNIHLHYLTNRVEIDVVLPLESATRDGTELGRQLKERIHSLPYIGAINIYYAL